jgi:predicted DNA-binding helix-hairpin-helix protein
MIVGATPGTDAQILNTASTLYRRHRLRRVYYSAYSPIQHVDDRLPNQGPPLVREHRLYQSDWLMRFYGFGVEELTTPQEPNLPLDIDPKLSWALRNRGEFPVDVNSAPRWKLLRVPGLGVRNVTRMLEMRRWRRLRLEDLRRLRVPLKKVRPFVLTEDFNPEALRIDQLHLGRRVQPARQLELFEMARSATTGEV